MRRKNPIGNWGGDGDLRSALTRIIQRAVEASGVSIEVKKIVIGIDGKIGG